MIKLKLLFFSLLSSLLFLVTTSTVFADVYPGTNYEIVSNRIVKDINTGELLSFYTTELRDAYLESKSTYQTRSNATGVADYRTSYSYSYSYKSSATSGARSSTAYGGKAGATLTVGAGVSFSAPESGAGLSLNHSVSHNVPPYTYGYIRLKASYTVNVRKLEVRYLGTNKWVPAGETSTISNVSVWSELVTWK